MGNNKEADELMPSNSRNSKNNASLTKSHLLRGLAMPTIPEFLAPNSQRAVNRVTDF